MPSTDPLRAALVLPTYNESENLAAMVAAIQSLPTPIHIIVVDDNSPDGTGAIADALAAQSSSVEVIHRSGKLGLGTAYAAGFQRAIAAGNDLILTMDADFSHDPNYLPAILAASKQYDLVIGSRYVPGGGVRDWPWHRQLLSWGANTHRSSAVGPARTGLHGGIPLLSAASFGGGGSIQHPGQWLLLSDRDVVLLRALGVHRR